MVPPVIAYQFVAVMEPRKAMASDPGKRQAQMVSALPLKRREASLWHPQPKPANLAASAIG
jgi:hypothetical protein